MKHRLAAALGAAIVAVLAAFAGTSLAGNGHGGGKGHDQSSQSSQSQSQQGVKPSNSTQHNTYANASSDKTKQYGNGKTAGEIATQAGQPNATLHGPGNSQPHKTSCGGHEVDVHALKSHESKCGTPTTGDSGGTSPVTQGYTTFFDTNVTLCHQTGPSTYVTISPLASVVVAQYMSQSGDIIPPFTYNGQTYSLNWDTAHQAIYNNGCNVPPVVPSVTPAATPPAAAVTPPAAPIVPAATAAPATAPATPTATPAGSVLGATATLTPKATRTASAPVKAKPAGGVLGATTHLGHVVGSSTLPFTGLRLWIIALVAAVLILAGFLVRRTTSEDRI